MKVADRSDLDEILKSAVDLDIPYFGRERSSSGQGRESAVLALFAYSRSVTERNWKSASILLTKRSENLEHHRGQMAFPGGVMDPEDVEQEGLVTTALREADEEVGIKENQVSVIGRLPELSTMTGFRVTPVIAIAQSPLEDFVLVPNPTEIAEALWISVEDLLHPETYRLEKIQAGNYLFPTHVYQVRGYRIWGATAAILKNILERLSSLEKRTEPLTGST